MSARKSKGIILFYGTDEATVKRRAAEAAQELAPDDAMNFETIDGGADLVDDALRSIQEVRASILTLPFLGSGKFVWWKNVDFLTDTVPGKSARVQDSLKAMIPDLNVCDGETVTLLISATGINKVRSFGKALIKAADTHEIKLPDMAKIGEEELIYRIEDRCRAFGLNPEPAATERLFQAIGTDFGALESELEKLATYVGVTRAEDGSPADHRPLTADDVRLMVGMRRGIVVWDFCDAVLQGDAKAAIALLDRLLSQGESEIGIIILLADQVRQAALAAVLREQGLLREKRGHGDFVNYEILPEGETIMPKKKDGTPINAYRLGQIARKSRHRSAQHWYDAVDRLYRANCHMLQGTGDKIRLLELAVLETCA